MMASVSRRTPQGHRQTALHIKERNLNTRSAAVKVRAAIAQTTAARRERRRLEQELAAYRTPAERLELDQMVSRHDPEETREIRAIMARQARQALHSATRPQNTLHR
jgi:hypothetical protein